MVWPTLGSKTVKEQDYGSSCGMLVVYEVVGFVRGDGRHSGRHRRSVVSSVKGDSV